MIEHWAVVARRRRLGAFRHRVAPRRRDDGHLVPGPVRRVHPRHEGGLGQGRQHPALPRRLGDRAGGDRAIAQTKMTISQRGLRSTACCAMWCAPGASTISWCAIKADGSCCTGSRSTKRTASTRSTPSAQLRLDAQALAALPEGYRHLAYIQQRIGYQVKLDMPMLKGRGGRGAVPARRSPGSRAANCGVRRPIGVRSTWVNCTVKTFTHRADAFGRERSA